LVWQIDDLQKSDNALAREHCLILTLHACVKHFKHHAGLSCRSSGTSREASRSSALGLQIVDLDD